MGVPLHRRRHSRVAVARRSTARDLVERERRHVAGARRETCSTSQAAGSVAGLRCRRAANRSRRCRRGRCTGRARSSPTDHVAMPEGERERPRDDGRAGHLQMTRVAFCARRGRSDRGRQPRRGRRLCGSCPSRASPRPLYVTSAPGEPFESLRRRTGGAGSWCCRNGKDPCEPVPRHPLPRSSRARSRGSCRWRFDPGLREEQTLLRRLHGRERRNTRVVRYTSNGPRGAIPGSAKQARVSSRTSRRTTTAGSSSFGPDKAALLGQTATAAVVAAIRSATARASARPFAKIMRLNVNAPKVYWQLVAYGPPQPVAVLVRPRKRRSLHRRRRAG